MTKVRFFQTLVGISLLAYGIFFLFPLLPINHSPAFQSLLEYSGYGGLIPPDHPFVYLPVALLKIVASFGLFLFLTWGRWLLLAHIAISMALVPFIGVIIYTPMDGLASYVSATIDGALLILCFTPPYSEYMRRDE